MNVKEKKRKLVEDLYVRLREKICYKYTVVNITKLKSREDELFGLGEYLPNLLRSFISNDYYTRMEELGVWDEIVKKILKTKRYSREEDIVEFIDWIDTHKEFEDLINRDEVKELYDEIEKLEKQKMQTINALT